MVDGDRTALTQLKYALSILAEQPYKIIYFPIKNEGYDGYYTENYNLVLLRPELHFRRSEWFLLKNEIDKKHWNGKFAYSYNRDKMMDICKEMEHNWRKLDIYNKNRKLHTEEIIGDTIFFVLSKEECYDIYGSLETALLESEPSGSVGWHCSYSMGWVIK